MPTPHKRRAQGAHYTTEKNILKVIEPLFMDDLHAEFERVRIVSLNPDTVVETWLYLGESID